jgi:hypothetical protein
MLAGHTNLRTTQRYIEANPEAQIRIVGLASLNTIVNWLQKATRPPNDHQNFLEFKFMGVARIRQMLWSSSCAGH